MMKFKRKHSLDFYIGAFWVAVGIITIQGGWFIVSIPLHSKEVWMIVLDVTGKEAIPNFMIGLFLFAVGFFELIFGVFMSFTRDSSVDDVVKKNKSDFEPKDTEPEEKG